MADAGARRSLWFLLGVAVLLVGIGAWWLIRSEPEPMPDARVANAPSPPVAAGAAPSPGSIRSEADISPASAPAVHAGDAHSSLRGVVVREDVPESGIAASVAVFDADANELARTESSAEGAFALDVPARTHWSRVVAAVADGRRGILRRGPKCDAEHLVVRVPDVESISGFVRFANGSSPSRPVRVFAWDVRDPGPHAIIAWTGRIPAANSGGVFACDVAADGSFSVAVPAGRTYVLDVSGGGVVALSTTKSPLGESLNFPERWIFPAGSRDVSLTVGTSFVLDCIGVDRSGATARRGRAHTGDRLRVASLPEGWMRSRPSLPDATVAERLPRYPDEDAARLTVWLVTRADNAPESVPIAVVGSISGFERVETEIAAARADRYEGPARIQLGVPRPTGRLSVRWSSTTSWWWDVLEPGLERPETALGFLRLEPTAPGTNERDFLEIELFPTRDPIVLEGIPVGAYGVEFGSQVVHASDETQTLLSIAQNTTTDLPVALGAVGGVQVNSRFDWDGETVEIDATLDVTLEGPRPGGTCGTVFVRTPVDFLRAIPVGDYTYRFSLDGEDLAAGDLTVAEGRVTNLDLTLPKPRAVH